MFAEFFKHKGMKFFNIGMRIQSLGYTCYRDLYLDWVNNFLTVKGFAEHHNIDEKTANELINDSVWLYGE